MNMFLHGEDNHRIEWGDTIRNPKLLDGTASLKHFDIVVANPPFSLEKWGFEGADADKFSRFRRGLPPRTKGDYAFILHMVETMKPGTGRMAVVVPHGVLFRGAAEGRIRQKLIEENLLDVVIGLPEKLFYGTGIPAAVLVFRKNKSDEKVLFIDATRCGLLRQWHPPGGDRGQAARIGRRQPPGQGHGDRGHQPAPAQPAAGRDSQSVCLRAGTAVY
jgi:type I restriction enzyme M protein